MACSQGRESQHRSYAPLLCVIGTGWRGLSTRSNRRQTDLHSVAPLRLGVSIFHFWVDSGLPALSACPRCAHSFCCSGVIFVGASPAGTELHRIVSSNPGAEKMKVKLAGSVPVFFKLIHVFSG